MVFSANFNNISAIPWQSVSLVEETGEGYKLHTHTWHPLFYISYHYFYSPALSIAPNHKSYLKIEFINAHGNGKKGG